MSNSDFLKIANKTATMILSEDVPPLALEDFKKYLFVSARAYLNANKLEFENSTHSKSVNTLLKQYLADKQLSIMFIVTSPSEEDSEKKLLNFITDLKGLHEGKCLMCFKQIDFGIEERKRGFLRYFRKKLHMIDLGTIDNDFNPLQVARSYIVNAFMPVISDFKVNISTAKQEQANEESQIASNQMDVKDNNIEFADFMHRKLQDLDLMLMKDKGVTTIAKITLQFDERIRDACSENPNARIEDVDSSLTETPNISQTLMTQYWQRWKKQINALIVKSYETKFNSVSNEIKFYNDLHSELENVDSQLQKQELRITLELIQKGGKRLSAEKLFKELSVKEKLNEVEKIKDIMNEIPIDKLQNLSTFQEVKEVISNIFQVLKKLLNLDYSNEKYTQIENNVVKEMFDKVVEIIKKKDILNIPLDEYDKFYQEYKEYVLNSWKEKNRAGNYNEGMGLDHHRSK